MSRTFKNPGIVSKSQKYIGRPEVENKGGMK